MITLELVTLKGLKYAKDVHEVLLPTPQGQIAVFDNHSSLVSLVEPGVVSIRENPNQADKDMEVFATNGGVVEITKNRIRMLVDEANKSSDISEKEAAEALGLAKKMAAEADDQVALDKATSMIKTQQANLRIAELKNFRKRR